MKKFPIGISTLAEIINNNYYYVDKTKHVGRLVDSGKYYFLSRPRRFGKSLLIDTLKQAFLGNKELFKGLYLEHNWDWSKNYPIIHISFGSNVTIANTQMLFDTIQNVLQKIAENYDLNLRGAGQNGNFLFLINDLYKKFNQQVVILVDEYDKPILDSISNLEVAYEMRNVLRGLYSVIKDNDDKIRFTLLTGVSRFSKTGVFSGLNNLNDITYDKQYATICGYTQTELEETFKEHLTAEDLPRIKQWYNGYNFIGHEGVYNPFSILSFFAKNKEYRNYWFATGTPTFLIDLLVKKKYYLPKLHKATVAFNSLDSFNIEDIDLNLLLLQTGYLTVARVYPSPINPDYAMLELTEPNEEVRISLQNYLINYMTGGTNAPPYLNEAFVQGFLTGEPQEFEEGIKSLFASIPYNWYVNNDIANYEGFYCSLMYAFFNGMGYHLIAEDTTNFGRMDLTILVQDKVFVFEFKTVNIAKLQNTPSALAQIKLRNYAEKYRSKYKEIYLIGVEFDEKVRNLVKYEWEKLNN
jgi:hypothetical protein